MILGIPILDKSEIRIPKSETISKFKYQNHKTLPSPLMGEGWGEGEQDQAPSPSSPPAWGGDILF
jgi:hypothetical protein